MKKYLPHIVVGSLMLFAIPISCYVLKFNILSDVPQDWGSFGDYLGGLLNPIISLLTLIVTAYIAISLYNYEHGRDKQAQSDNDINSFKELYEFFISKEFREVRIISWYILKKAIVHEAYGRFILRENYVSRYILREHRANVYLEFKDFLYQNDHPESALPENEQQFLRQEALDRNKVDTLINFYQLLSLKKIPEDYFKICDFYYDTWRPLLYWYATGIEVAYNQLEENRRYNNPPTLLEALTALDKVFYKPTVLASLNEEMIDSHPIIKHMRGQ